MLESEAQRIEEQPSEEPEEVDDDAIDWDALEDSELLGEDDPLPEEQDD